MNMESILKCTTNFREDLLQDLADPGFAKHYLEVSLEEYEQDGDTEMLAHSIRNVIEAQGGADKLAPRTNGSLQRLYETLEAKHAPPLTHLVEILAGLGFQTRICLDRSIVTDEVDAYTTEMLSLEPMDSTHEAR